MCIDCPYNNEIFAAYLGKWPFLQDIVSDFWKSVIFQVDECLITNAVVWIKNALVLVTAKHVDQRESKKIVKQILVTFLHQMYLSGVFILVIVVNWPVTSFQ